MGMLLRAIVQRNQNKDNKTHVSTSTYTSVGAIRFFALLNLISGIICILISLFNSNVIYLWIGLGSLLLSPFQFVIAHICDDIREIKESLLSSSSGEDEYQESP